MWPMQIVQPNTLTGCSTRLVLLTPRAARRHRRRRYTSPWPPSSSPAQTGYPSGHTEIIMHWSVLQFQSSDIAFLPREVLRIPQCRRAPCSWSQTTTSMASAIFLSSEFSKSVTSSQCAGGTQHHCIYTSCIGFTAIRPSTTVFGSSWQWNQYGNCSTVLIPFPQN